MTEVLAAAVVPAAPVLVPALAGAAAPELVELRAACDDAVDALLEALGGDGTLVVLGAGPSAHDWPGDAPATFRGLVAADLPGLDVPPLDVAPVDVVTLEPDHAAGPTPVGERLPLPLTLGRWYLRRALERGRDLPREVLWRTVADSDTSTDTDFSAGWAGDLGGPLAVLAVGDLAAAHGPKAPVAEHPGAASYDEQVVSALASGDLRRLGSTDRRLAAEVGARSTAVWATLAALGSTGRGDVMWRGAPYGVGYVVATWQRG